MFRIEGYVAVSSAGDTVPLDSYWNDTVADNAAVNPRRDAPGAGWTRYRNEGYLFGPGVINRTDCSDPAAVADQDLSPWQALAHQTTTWRGATPLTTGDTFVITATGDSQIDLWGTRKTAAGEGIAGTGWPAPEGTRWGLVGRVTAGRMWVPRRGWYEAGEWFPIGAGVRCIQYNAQGGGRGDIQVQINDTSLWDNSGGPSVTVREWYP